MYRYDLSGKRIMVAGHKGMVGRALCRRLEQEDCELLTLGRSEADLIDQRDTQKYLQETKPDALIVAAAKVGGILANKTYPVDFLYDNMMIAANLIQAAYHVGVERVVFLGSSCIYPKFANQPIDETSLLTGKLEPTNEWYAIAKIAGIKLVQAYREQYGVNYISAMPTNLYGPFDNFDLESSHVVPALIRKVHQAKNAGLASIEIWGTGEPRREFLHVDDCADAIIHLTQNYDGALQINMGCGEDIKIIELTQLICKIIGFKGDIKHDLSKPDGTPRKLLNTQRLSDLGWNPKTPLEQGLTQAYNWYLDNISS